MLLQILEEYKNIKKLQQDFVERATQQWTITNAQREERNKILKQIVNKYNEDY